MIVTRKLCLEKIIDILAEAAKAFVLYFKVLQDGFIKSPCYVVLVFCPRVLDVSMKTWKSWRRHAEKFFLDKQQFRKGVRPGSLVFFNFAKIGNVWVSKEAVQVMGIAFLCRVQILTPCSTYIWKIGIENSIVNWFIIASRSDEVYEHWFY